MENLFYQVTSGRLTLSKGTAITCFQVVTAHSHIFPKDKRTFLTDCVDDPKAIVLWSVENGEQLMRKTLEYVISSFAISQDGSHIAVGDVTGSIYFFDVNRWHGHGLSKCRDASCG